jgi:hypothetical protein
LSGKVILRGTYGDETASVAATTTIADTNTYNLRSSDLIQSLKGEVKFGAIKLFTTVEGARSSLNQTNAIFRISFRRRRSIYAAHSFRALRM